MFYDEFSVSEQNSCYYGWAKRNTRPQVKSNEASRKRLNGMLAIDVESGEEYLWLSSHAQSDDVARYMAHLTWQMEELGVERLEIVLDQNTTHKQRMQQLYQEELSKLTAPKAHQNRGNLYLPACLFSQTQCGGVCHSPSPAKVPASPALQHENGTDRTTPNKRTVQKTTALLLPNH
jgi:hypothetical protein